MKIRTVEDVRCPNCGNSTRFRGHGTAAPIYVTCVASDALVYNDEGYLDTTYTCGKSSVTPDLEFSGTNTVLCGECREKGTLQKWTVRVAPTSEELQAQIADLLQQNECEPHGELAHILVSELFEEGNDAPAA